jgi:hypothetical protein
MVGLIPIPILQLGKQAYSLTVESFVDGAPFVDTAPDEGTAGLSLERVRQLLSRFPYDPHVDGT